MSKTRIGIPCSLCSIWRTLLYAIFLGTCCSSAMAEWLPVSPKDDDPQRTEPVEPFKIVDGVYFVGARLHLPSYLFTTSEGHILLDTTYDELVPEIVANIEKLGFKVDDIKLLLASHAHHDHVGGHASMREISGAITLATAADADVMETGGKTDFRDAGLWAPVTVDRIIVDGEKVRLGDRVLTAHLTPGHTKGCVTWTTVVEENGKQYNMLVLGGLRINTNEALVGNPDFPDMAQQFAWSLARLKVLPVDFYLGVHGYWFDLKGKHERLLAGTDSNPFIDPEGYQRAIRFWEDAYLKQLRQELLAGE